MSWSSVHIRFIARIVKIIEHTYNMLHVCLGISGNHVFISDIRATIREHFWCTDFAFHTYFWLPIIFPAYTPPRFFSHIFLSDVFSKIWEALSKLPNFGELLRFLKLNFGSSIPHDQCIELHDTM